MRILSTRLHGMIDYAMGILLMASPFLLGFATQGAKQWLPMILGAGSIAYSLVTDYELGIARLLPMRAHLGLDAASGVLLAVSPWLFGFSDLVFWPHLLLGLIAVTVVLITDPNPRPNNVTAGAARRPPGN